MRRRRLSHLRPITLSGEEPHFSGADEASASDGASPLLSLFGRPDAWTPDERRAILVPEG